jgi:hypothetical protein
MWYLAGRYAQNGLDPRAYVDAVVKLNDLHEPPQPGERLRLPR